MKKALYEHWQELLEDFPEATDRDLVNWGMEFTGNDVKENWQQLRVEVEENLKEFQNT